MSLINKRYADYYNTKNRITGHVFEKRYYDKVIASKQGMLEVSRYIHLNPVDANMVLQLQSYQWSSYRYYMYTSRHHLFTMAIILDYFSGDELVFVPSLPGYCHTLSNGIMVWRVADFFDRKIV